MPIYQSPDSRMSGSSRMFGSASMSDYSRMSGQADNRPIRLGGQI